MPDKELLIEQAWLSYRTEVIPAAAPQVQVTESRRAFYAGAQSLFGAIMNILEPGAEATEGDMETMSSIDAELRRFGAQVKAGLR